LLKADHPAVWNTLEEVGSPLSALIAMIEGHPIVAEGSAAAHQLLGVDQQMRMIIVSPDVRTYALLATFVPAVRLDGVVTSGHYASTVLVRGPGQASSIYRIPSGGTTIRAPVRLSIGLNRVVFTPVRTSLEAVTPSAQLQLYVKGVSLASD
jgi:hypothetical protein